MFAIERAWCAFPATPETSATLLAAHVAVLLGVWFADADARLDVGAEAVGGKGRGGKERVEARGGNETSSAGAGDEARTARNELHIARRVVMVSCTP